MRAHPHVILWTHPTLHSNRYLDQVSRFFLYSSTYALCLLHNKKGTCIPNIITHMASRRYIRFCMAHGCVQQRQTQTTLHGSGEVWGGKGGGSMDYKRKGISIDLAISAGLMVMSNRQTDIHTTLHQQQ